MTEDKSKDLGKMLKQRRLMIPLTLQKMASAAGVSPSHLGRIERGERFPSAWILRKIAKPLGLGEDELFASAGFLSPKTSEGVEKTGWGRLDPLVEAVLSQEPVEVQRAVMGILAILKSLAKESGGNIGFAEYVRRNYPQVDEDIITMVQDILEHPQGQS
ncbi:MAG TPA: helix-turn-helix domain-containing protein [Dehalococcoidia bacterium]|nr:helix-turn-helix domain-containing protein [Dehalococcoidia bacterium]